jgi:aminoglycoside phosphotransferase
MVSGSDGERIARLEAQMENMERLQQETREALIRLAQKADETSRTTQEQLAYVQSTLDKAAGGAKWIMIGATGVGSIAASVATAIAWFVALPGKH